MTYHPSNDQIVLAFRGSKNVENWIQNLQFVMDNFRVDSCPDCLVHYGFQTMWDSFKDEMLDDIFTLISMYPTASIGVTGHSLGAALATLAAYDAKVRFSTVDAYLYNTGSPRVGNSAFYDKMKELYPGKSFRVVHANDVVPHWPNELL